MPDIEKDSTDIEVETGSDDWDAEDVHCWFAAPQCPEYILPVYERRRRPQ